MTTRQMKYGGNQCWVNKIYSLKCSTAPTSAPTVTTDSLLMHGAGQFSTMTGTVVSNGGGSLTGYGFVWSSVNNPPTIADNISLVGSGFFSGPYGPSDVSLITAPTGVNLYFAAYATNAIGTGYGAVLIGVIIPCLAGDTLITLANRKKKAIAEITYDDELLVWNFDECKFDAAKPVWMYKSSALNNYEAIRFSNGEAIKVVADKQGHRIYNVGRNQFTYSIKDAPFGTRTFTESGETPYVVSKEIVEEKTTFYNIITDRHINIFANGVLTSTGLNNIYPIDNMKFIKEERELRNKEEFGVSDELFYGLRLAEQPEDSKLVEKVRTLERIKI